MKVKSKYLFIIYFLASFLAVKVPIFSQKIDLTKKAFLIGIANYSREGGWAQKKPLSSLDDLLLLKSVLKKQGFDSTNITEVSEQKATKVGIIKEFESFKKKLKTGDKVIFHFSGHGQQIFDFSGDEPDQLDEALVVYDSPIEAQQNQIYKGESHLLDDELGAMFDELRLIVGVRGHIVAFIDACYSGTASRSDVISRGGKKPIIPKNKVVLNQITDESISGFVESNPKFLDNEAIGQLVVFGGSASDAVNFEIYDEESKLGYGSLTFGVCKAFSLLNSTTTYRQFYSEVVNTVTTLLPFQTPMAEGNIDQLFFNGEIKIQSQYFPVRTFDGQTITLEGGTLNNLQINSKISFLPSGTQNPDKLEPTYSGTVVSASPLYSLVQIDQTVPSDLNINTIWAFVKEYSYNNLELKVFLKDIEISSISKVKSALKQPHIIWVENQIDADLDIKQNLKMQQFSIVDSKTNLAFGNPISLNKLSARIATFIKVKILKGYTGADIDLKTDTQIRKVNSVSKCNYLVDLKSQNTVQNISIGQNVCIITKNLSEKQLYITIVEFWADGTLHQIYPLPNTLVDPLKPNREHNNNGIVSKGIDEPFGQHIIKVFATAEKQLDFSSLVDAQFRSKNGAIHSLENFIYKAGAMPAKESKIENKLYTQTLVYNLIPSIKHE